MYIENERDDRIVYDDLDESEIDVNERNAFYSIFAL